MLDENIIDELKDIHFNYKDDFLELFLDSN